MGSNTSKSGLEKAFGNAFLPRVSNPTIRGSIRRADPDGSHASPFFLSLTGKTLIVEVTPVVGNITINFSSDLMSDAIAAINAASPSNLKAVDDDGYIRIINLNTGNKNSLTIKGGTSLTFLGFILTPEPGSISFAGDIATASPGRGQTGLQNNPHGTHLLAQDEDLTTSVINRGIVGSLGHAERIIRDLDREIPIIRKIAVTTITLPTTAEHAFVIANPAIRFPVDGFGLAGSNPTGLILDQLVRLKSFPDDIDVYDIAQTDPVPHISKVVYNPGSIGVSDNTQTFAVWGTPDGKSVFNSQLRNKQPPVTISNVRGNVIESSTAAFVTNVTQPGDTLIIESASNNTPFNHNGEFVVTEVIDETRVAVRAKGSAEKTYVVSSIPTELNANLPGGSSYGTARVIVGSYIPATALTFIVPSWISSATNFYVHLYCGVRVRDLQPGDIGVRFSANDETVLNILRTHITTAAGFRHHAVDVDAAVITSTPHSIPAGTVADQLTALLALDNSQIAAEVAYAGGPAWRDATTNPSTTVEAQLDKIISDLTGAGGAIKIGYAGGPTWADGTTNPATGVETQLDKIVTDLAGTGGAIKIGYAGGPTWADASTNPATTIEAQLDKIISDLAGTGGAIKIGYAGGPVWADSTTNPATTIEAQLDKIVSDLAGAAGTGKIQGSIVGTDLAVGTLAAQIANLATNWFKLGRANTITGLQTFSSLITANGGLTTSSGITFTGSADEHHPDREFSIDCSGFQNDFAGFLNDGSQGFLQRTAFDGSNAILLQSFKVGAGNSSGQTALVCDLERIRVGDRISSIEVCLAQSGTPNGIEFFTLVDNGPTSTIDNVVFTSGTLTRPGTGAIISSVTSAINYTHTTGSALRLRIITSSSSGGTMYVRWVIIKYQRP